MIMYGVPGIPSPEFMLKTYPKKPLPAQRTFFPPVSILSTAVLNMAPCGLNRQHEQPKRSNPD